MRRQHLHGSVRKDLKVTEEAHLDIEAVPVVKPLWPISPALCTTKPKLPRDEDGMTVNLEGIVCRLRLAHVADIEPDLVDGCPHHPSADILPLQLVELAVGDLLLDGHLPHSVDGHRHLAEDGGGWRM